MATSIDYVELTCRSNYSFLRGASFPEELVAQAARLGLKGMALTDKDGVYGVPRAWVEAKGHPGFKLICGAELSLEGRAPLILLARDRPAYGLLCRLLTASHADKPKGEAALAWDSFLEMAARPGGEGLVALAPSGAGEDLGPLKELFKDRLYLSLSRHFDGKGRADTLRAREMSRRFGLPLLACNDVHYHVPGRRVLQDLVSSIREGVRLSEAGARLFPNAERCLKSAAQMARLFSDLPEALRLTVEVAEACTFSLAELRYRYPSEWIPAGVTAQQHLEDLADQGARRRYPAGVPASVRDQLRHELELVDTLKFADYFLTLYEIIEFARSKDILFQGRGSAANSALCFCLGITAIDPTRANLLFERFLSAERGEPPDIDVDFEHERREEVIQHIYEKYGRDRAAMVAAVVTYRSRSAVRETAKALGVDPESVPNPETRGIKSEHALVQSLAAELQGFPRHLSIHSGGFVLCGDFLVENVPVEPARMEGRSIVQWDKNDLDAVGLLKVDVLALGMLTALHKSMALAGVPDLAAIPAEDRATYEMIQKGDTVGVFQIESRAQINMVGRLKPATFYDLVIEVAIVRPGPIVGKMVHPYLRRRRGEEAFVWADPRLNAILGRTLGVPLFQEQIMKLAMDLAGFTPGEADRLRRAIGAWRSSGSVAEIGQRLMQGLLASGLPEDFVRRIFEQIKGFAEYGFPESHAASFALLAYASAWLKCHHPAEFCCALLNSQPLGFYAPHTLVDDARRHGVKVLPLDPNLSAWDCQMEAGALRLGWRLVSGLGKEKVRALVEDRSMKPYTGLWDFLERSRLKSAVLQNLALGHAFDCFGYEPRMALWELLKWEVLGGGLFSGQTSSIQEELFAPLKGFERVQQDYHTYGLSLDAHPMQALRREMEVPGLRSSQARASAHGTLITASGLVIVRQRPETAGGTVFATLEDEEGFVDLILPKPIYQKYLEVFSNHSFLAVRGILQKDGNSHSLLVRKAWAVGKEAEVKAGSHDWH